MPFSLVTATWVCSLDWYINLRNSLGAPAGREDHGSTTTSSRRRGPVRLILHMLVSTSVFGDLGCSKNYRWGNRRQLALHLELVSPILPSCCILSQICNAGDALADTKNACLPLFFFFSSRLADVCRLHGIIDTSYTCQPQRAGRPK